MKKTYFVLSDIHSFYTKMMDALTEKNFNIKDDSHIIILCGDAFDRGDESVEMFDFLKYMSSKKRLIYIKGNHEDLLLSCYNELISNNGEIESDSVHYHNGTYKTVCDLCGINYNYYLEVDLVKERISPLIDFIDNNCVDYYEIGDKIFTHGWIPCGYRYLNRYAKEYKFYPNWRKASAEDWEFARWINGMEAAKNGVVEPEKTIVCGHWHCSWGWSHLLQERKEFPPTNRVGWEKSFEPFVQPGIMAIDACTAYSGIVNVYVFENN